MAAKPASARSRPPATDVLPTTKWANRVLRPLNSIVLRLEKHWKSTAPPDCKNSSNSNNRTAQHNNTSPRKRTSLPGATSRGKFSDGGAQLSGSESSRDDSDDPSWVPGQGTRRKVRHKYSSGNPRVKGRFGGGVGGGVSIFGSPESRRRSLPGEITIATPLIVGRTTRQFFAADEDKTQPFGEDQDSAVSVSGGFGLKQKGAQDKHKEASTSRVNGFQDYDDWGYLGIVDNIGTVFETFLRATSNKKPATTLGAKSLMSMALAKVSDYIEGEQKLHDESEDKDEEADMADVIFTEMEDFYGLPGGGWRPLKELVRAHGIRVICECVRKKWLSPQTTQRLIITSLRLSSHDAAESLFSALLSIAPNIDRPKGLHSCLFSSIYPGERTILSPYLDMVSSGAPGHLSFFFREIRLLILRGVVPVEWMATESVKPFMNRAVQSISCGDENFSSSVEFLQAVVLVAAGIDTSIYRSTLASLRTTKRTRLRYGGSAGPGTSPLPNDISVSRAPPSHLRTALNNTISSLVTLLSGIHISRFGVGAGGESSPARDMITRLSTAVQQDIELRCSDSKSEFTALQSTRCSYILLGEYLCLGEGFGNDARIHPGNSSLLSNFDSFIQTMSNRKDLLGELSGLVGQVVTCCGRAQGTDGFDELKGFSQILTSDNVDPYTSLKLLLGKIAVESTMNFAESTQHPDHHEWATHIQTEVAAYNLDQDISGDAECPTPSPSTLKTGFRWEDSIGEWVAKTPAANSARNLYIKADCKTTIPDSQDSCSSPIQCFSNRKTSFAIREDNPSVVPSSPPPSSPPQSSRKRSRIESSPFTYDIVPNKKSKTTLKCVEVSAPSTTTTNLPRPSGLRQKHTWKPYTDDIDDIETYPFPLSPSRSPDRSSTTSPRRRTDRETRSTTGERVLRERKQNTHLSRSTRPSKRKSITFEVVVVNKKRKGSMNDDHDDDDGDDDWSGSSPGSRPRTRQQFQRSPSEESYLPPEKRRKRESHSRKSEIFDNHWVAPCSSVEIADSEGSDDELSFL